MLKKINRLSKKEFDHFFKEGRRTHGLLVQVIYSKEPDFHGAVVVGKKVYPKAHDRNRLRRRLYAVLYDKKVAKNLKGVYIVLVKPTAKAVPYLNVKAELVQLIDKLNL